MTTTKSVLEMDSKEAKEFFLAHDSYCNLDLPQYFDFAPLLTAVDKALGKGQVSYYFAVPAGATKLLKPSECEGVCYTVLHNKDGKYAWRPIKLIHPAIYVDLVNKITEAANWIAIKSKFGEFQNNKRIQCGSLLTQPRSFRHSFGESVRLSFWFVGGGQGPLSGAFA
jgi:RNA-directed DNA polymerase